MDRPERRRRAHTALVDRPRGGRSTGRCLGEEEVEKMNKAAVMNCEYSGAAYYSTLFMLLSKYVGCDAKLEPAADRRGFQLIAPLKEEQLDMQNIANCARLIAEKNAV